MAARSTELGDVALGSDEEAVGEAVPSVELGVPSGEDAVHPTTNTSSSARVARTPAGVGVMLGFGRIIPTTLAARGADGPVGARTRRKCDKTTPFGLTAPTSLSYVGSALIGGNRGRGAGKGR